MEALLISVLVCGVAVLGMSIGVIFGREPIRGSCGGVGGSCALCTRPCKKRRKDGMAPDEGKA